MALDFDTSLLETAYEPNKSSIATAPPEAFEEDENNPRFEHKIVPEFDDDIKENGILQPIIVRLNELTGKLKIRFGSRRYRAALRIGLKKIPYFITEDSRQFSDYAQVSENEQREPLTPLELAHFIKRKIDAGDKKKVIAKKLRKDASAITQYLALINAPPFILELYESHKCRSVRYLYDLRNLYNQYGEKVIQLCSEVSNFDIYKIEEITARLNETKAAIKKINDTAKKQKLSIDQFKIEQEEKDSLAKDVPKSKNDEILGREQELENITQESVVFETNSAANHSAVPVVSPETLTNWRPANEKFNTELSPLDILQAAILELKQAAKELPANDKLTDSIVQLHNVYSLISMDLNPHESVVKQITHSKEYLDALNKTWKFPE